MLQSSSLRKLDKEPRRTMQTDKGVTNLVGHGDEEGQQEHVAVPGEPPLDVLFGEGEKVPKHSGEERYRYHEVVAVRLDEVVTSDRRRIYVVFSERPQKVLKVKDCNRNVPAGFRCGACNNYTHQTHNQ